MTASELIRRLEDIISYNGDFPILIDPRIDWIAPRGIGWIGINETDR